MKQDMGLSHHSLNLISDINFKFFIDIVNNMSHRFMTESGFNIEGHTPYLTELWVQEFSKNGDTSFFTQSLEPTSIWFLFS